MKTIHNLPYDKTNSLSIESYAQNLIGLTTKKALGFQQLLSGNKGGLGQILEKNYFRIPTNSRPTPDFEEAGVELKVTGYLKDKSGNPKAKERLVLNIINYLDVHYESFETSSFLTKNNTLLIIFYLYIKGENRLDFPIDYVQLFQFPKKDLKIIEDDWNKIMNKIKEGKAHEISEGDTNYLGACTKGSSSKTVREQPFSPILAKQRAFSLKRKYLEDILNDYFVKGKVTYKEPIIKDAKELDDTTFEEYVINKINIHKGKKIVDLAKELNVLVNPGSKSFTSHVAKAMLGVVSNNIEEFDKANIKIKTIRIGKNNKIKEHMSFPTFKFKDIINEDWEESTLRNMFLDTRFLFIIYQFDKYDNLLLKKGMFWNISNNDLETEVRNVWQKTINIIEEGVTITHKGKRTYNNLPSPSENQILHVRPHARNKEDTYPLPGGGNLTKQSFWLNNSYILNQIY